MILGTPHGHLYYEVTDITPPWVEHPETIVFCHGVATTCDIWAAWLPVLAPHFRIVRFDTRGFGRSLICEGGFDWSVDALADDILAVARAAGAGRFHLVGESIGGTVSLHLAACADPPLLSVSCISTTHRGMDIHRIRGWRDFVAKEGIAAWSLQMMEHRFYPGALSESEWQWFHSVQSQTCLDSLLEVGDLLLRTNLSEELSCISVPTLLLTPDASPFVSVDISNEVHKLIEHSEMAVFPNSRHGLPFSKARQCAEAVRTFLERRTNA